VKEVENLKSITYSTFARSFLTKVNSRPTRKIVIVPITIIMLSCNGLLRNEYFSGNKDEKVIQRIATAPIIVAVRASMFLLVLLTMPKRNKPSTPPANIPDSFHQTSSMLLAPIMAIPVPMPSNPKITVPV